MWARLSPGHPPNWMGPPEALARLASTPLQIKPWSPSLRVSARTAGQPRPQEIGRSAAECEGSACGSETHSGERNWPRLSDRKIRRDRAERSICSALSALSAVSSFSSKLSGLHLTGRLKGMMCSHSLASERATTATTGSVSLTLNTSCGTPGSMKMKSPAWFSTTDSSAGPYSCRT
jgi:hypothetical protein